MSPILRAGWGSPHTFSAAERKQLLGELHKDGDAAERFLDDVQKATAHFRADWQGYSAAPLEAPATARQRLRNIELTAAKLREALDRLDEWGSRGDFTVVESTIYGGITDIDELTETLWRLQTTARVVRGQIVNSRAGRHPDQVEMSFIRRVGALYVKHFQSTPPHTRGTRFVKFIGMLFGIVQPGNPHATGDPYKIVTRALKAHQPPK